MIRLNLFMIWFLHFLSLLSVICMCCRQNLSSRIIVVLAYTVSMLIMSNHKFIKLFKYASNMLCLISFGKHFAKKCLHFCFKQTFVDCIIHKTFLHFVHKNHLVPLSRYQNIPIGSLCLCSDSILYFLLSYAPIHWIWLLSGFPHSS